MFTKLAIDKMLASIPTSLLSKSIKPKVVMFGLVRDKDGNPKIEGDPNDLPEQTKALLTEQEKQSLGIK